MAARKVRVVCYAVNGSGLGHLTRLAAICRWIRRYAAHAGACAEIYFLTSSEADSILFREGFASFKLPSKTAVAEAGIDKIVYLSLAKQWVWHSLGLLRPDLLIVDTFPRGSFGELLSALDLARRRAFIYRPLREDFAARHDFQAMLPLYDLILVPENEGPEGSVLVPEDSRHRVRHVGPVVLREPFELVGRADARRELGVPDDRLAVYITAGGGGDSNAQRRLLSVVDALAIEPDLHLVIGAGPLYRGRRRHGPGITWLESGGVTELLPGLDLAVASAGYNTFVELMQTGIPALFLPQEKIADEQHRRAARAVQAGAAVLLPVDGDLAGHLRTALHAWRDPAARAKAAAAARALVPSNGARCAAAELLELVLPHAAVEAAVATISDDLLTATRALDVPIEGVLDLARVLEPSYVDASPKAAALATAQAVGVLRHAAEAGVPVPTASELAKTFSRKLATATAFERAEATRLLLDALAPFRDWGGALSLLKIMSTEKQMPAGRLAAELADFLGRLRQRGQTIYQGIAVLSGARGAGVELSSNMALLRADTVGEKDADV